MTLEQFRYELKEIKKDYGRKEYELVKKYYESNAIYKLGDVVIDYHRDKYKINGMYYGFIRGISEFGSVFYNVESLKKDGTPKKRKGCGFISQSSIIEKI